MPNKLSVQIGQMLDKQANFSCTNYIIKTQKDEVLFEVPELIDYNRLLRSNIIGTSTVVYDTALMGKIFMPALPAGRRFRNLVKHREAV